MFNGNRVCTITYRCLHFSSYACSRGRILEEFLRTSGLTVSVTSNRLNTLRQITTNRCDIDSLNLPHPYTSKLSTSTIATSAMRFVQFETTDSSRCGLGVELGDGGDVVDLAAGNVNIPTDMKSFLERGLNSLLAAKCVVESGKNVLKRDSVSLLAPITQPDKVICIGMNYVDHCEEQGIPMPKEPVIFNKFPSTIIGPTADLLYPSETEELDWEVELVIVIGKKGKHIKDADAMSHVFGFTVAHDVSARDWQLRRNGGQWLLGKTMDTFCPLGPAIVMKEDLPDPHNLGLRCRVNGVVKQDSNTSNLVHKTETLITFASKFFTLLPGDIILTGTPPGVGCFRKPPEYLKRGDIVECEIDHIGKITNKII